MYHPAVSKPAGRYLNLEHNVNTVKILQLYKSPRGFITPPPLRYMKHGVFNITKFTNDRSNTRLGRWRGPGALEPFPESGPINQ